jgi:hypothetical protein
MDKSASVRRQPGPKTPGEGIPSAVMGPPNDTGVMEAPSATGKMPGDGMQGAAMGASSGTDKMPGDGMPGAAMGASSGTDKMPGDGMQGAGMGAPSATDKMPGDGMQGAAMGASSGTDKMPGDGMQGAGMGTSSAAGKMPGDKMQGAAVEAPSGKMPDRGMASAEKPVSSPHVLVKPGEALAADEPVGLGPYTRRGVTANFDVYYDNSLGTNGQHLADAVLANCEWDLFELRGWFGGVAAGRFSVYIDPGSFGAYHANCAATEIHCAAFSGTDGALVNMLNVAETDEVMMANQGAGWAVAPVPVRASRACSPPSATRPALMALRRRRVG